MPYIDLNNAQIHYTDTEQEKETIVFAHSLLCNLNMYEKQIQHLSPNYRCVAFDFRGQGKSQMTKDGYDMDSLAEDAKALIEKLNIGPCHFVGLSMGGFVGLRVAIRYPHLLRSLTLIDSSMQEEPKENLPKYNLLMVIARLFGFRIVTGQVLPILFSQHFLKDPSKKTIKQSWANDLYSSSRVGVLRAVKGVITRDALSGSEVEKIKVPTSIIVGEDDTATIPEKSEKIHQHIPHAQYTTIPKTGHLSSFEQPEEINKLLEQFIGNL